MRYCQGLELEYQLKLKCEHCKFSSESNNKLQFYISVSHKSLHNDELKEKEKNYKWMEPGFEYLAKTVIE